jgi:hypothetical protein
MFIKTTESFSTGTELNLTIISPQGDEIEIRAEVVHVVGDGEGKPPGVGVRFIEASPASKKTIRALLRHRSSPAKQALESKTPTLDEMVEQLLRVRNAPAHVALGVLANAPHDAISMAYRSLIQRFDTRLFADGTQESKACRELAAHLRHAYEELAGGTHGAPEPADEGSVGAANQIDDLWFSGRLAEALKLLEQSTHDYPNDSLILARRHVVKAQHLRRRGDVEVARRHLNKALIYDPSCRPAIAALRKLES